MALVSTTPIEIDQTMDRHGKIACHAIGGTEERT